MSMKNAKDIHSMEDLLLYIATSEKETSNHRRRGLIIVPGGGGKTTLVNALQSTNIHCADIDFYWDQEQQQNYVNQLTAQWKDACLDIQNKHKRQEIEDDYVILKSILSQEKWSNEEYLDILFVQTYQQATVLMDRRCFLLNLLPADQLHLHSLSSRHSSMENPPDDFDVCRRQWHENEQHTPYIFYDNFEQLQRIVKLFHQFILSKRS